MDLPPPREYALIRRPMKKALHIILIILALFLQPSCRRKHAVRWYKGNLHTHTTISDGDSSPESVIRWYKDHGYDFLAITDHDVLVATDEYKALCDENFILIPGMEVSDSFAEIPLHVLALGLVDKTLKPAAGSDISSTLQNDVAAIRAAGAIPVLCHPNFYWAYGAEELARVQDCMFFEVLNAHPEVDSGGGSGVAGTEKMWDIVLSSGKRMLGLGTDDLHVIDKYAGRSWIMLRAEELGQKAVLSALEKGDFYTSTGVVLDDIDIKRSRMKLWIRAEEGMGYATFFIGSGGRVLKSDLSLSPSYRFPRAERYVRAKVVDAKGRVALTQPSFLQGDRE